LLPADVIVTATGFNLNVMGDIALHRRRPAAGLCADRGLARRDVHRRAEHGLGVRLLPRQLDAACRPAVDFVCRLLQHMDDRGATVVTPSLRPMDQGMALKPWVEPENFNPGYMQRGIHLLPRQGSQGPWLHRQDYAVDKDELPQADLEDGSLVYR
jgi:monooxygenase